MNIIAFIPARKGSKSIPNKNIKELKGKPLIAYSIESAQRCDLKTIVNTDSEEIKKIAESYGVEIMMRPDRLAQDKTSMLEVLKSEIFKIYPLPDMVLLLQSTVPFRKIIHIKTAISYLKENKDYDSIISVERVPEKYNPYAMILELEGKKVLFRKLINFKERIISLFTGKKFVGPSLTGYPINQRMTRRQDLPQCWIPTGSIYLFKTENLKKGSIYGDKVMLLETEPEININTEDDFQKAIDYLKT